MRKEFRTLTADNEKPGELAVKVRSNAVEMVADACLMQTSAHIARALNANLDGLRGARLTEGARVGLSSIVADTHHR